MKEHAVNQLDNFIMGWYIDKNICDEIVSYFLKNKSLHTDKTKLIPSYVVYGDFLFDESAKELSTRYIQSLNNCLDLYKNKYIFSTIDQSSWVMDQECNIQYYPPGLAYSTWHSENKGYPNYTAKRFLVYMTYLNDVFENGETEFFYQKIKIKPEKGLTLIWPVYWNHTHRGLPTNFDKYVITGWYSYTTFDVIPSESFTINEKR